MSSGRQVEGWGRLADRVALPRTGRVGFNLSAVCCLVPVPALKLEAVVRNWLLALLCGDHLVSCLSGCLARDPGGYLGRAPQASPECSGATLDAPSAYLLGGAGEGGETSQEPGCEGNLLVLESGWTAGLHSSCGLRT